MKNIFWFSQVSKDNLKEVGGKGANLGEMSQAGLPVPNGFIVTAGAYFDFIKKNKLDILIAQLLHNLQVENTKALNIASDKIKKAILKANLPPQLQTEIKTAYRQLYTHDGSSIYVAVRSSATAEDLPQASFAGQQATFLNVSGSDEVVQAVKKAFASLFEPRAIYYRQINHFDHLKVGLAVPVQKMVQADKSGVLFTVDPLLNDKTKISIEAGYGLGEAVVSGSITPDRYLVDKKTLKILGKEIGQQTWKVVKVGRQNKHVSVSSKEQKAQKLTDEEITQLAKIGKKIEEHYGFPQDCEWAIEKGRIYFVQTRPVTTLKSQISNLKSQKEPKDKIGAEVILRGSGASVGIASGPVKVIQKATEIDKVLEGDVLVTEMTSPEFVPAMKRAVAIVTDTGGRTSHAAIVSRELGIPCVVGTGKATAVLKTGQIVSVDGAEGVVYKGKVFAPQASAQMKSELPSGSQFIPTATKVYLNLGEPELAQKVAKLPVDGVGLLRAEFMIATVGTHPKYMLEQKKGRNFIDQLSEGLRTVCAAFSPRPVVYRATDFKTNEYRHLKGGERYEPKEENPMLGFRGAFRYLKQPEVFELELQAILQVRHRFGLSNLWLMIPFVRTISELEEVLQKIDGFKLREDSDFKLWIMAEVPSVVFLIEEFLQLDIDGVSIGTNDLTQLILGIDRDSEILAEVFDERNQAVVRAVREIIRGCRKFHKTVSVCGQAPSTYPEFTEMLVKEGVTSVSVNPDVAVSTRQLVASVEQKVLLEETREET